MKKFAVLIVCVLSLLLLPSAALAEKTEPAEHFASAAVFEVQQIGPTNGPKFNEEQKMQLRGITSILYVILAAGALIVLKKQKDYKGS